MPKMIDKQVDKYNELELEFFSNGTPWTYTWKFDGDVCCLDWNYKDKKYEFWRNHVFIKSFQDVYAALDGIIMGKMTLRQMLLETDFNFSEIL